MHATASNIYIACAVWRTITSNLLLLLQKSVSISIKISTPYRRLTPKTPIPENIPGKNSKLGATHSQINNLEMVSLNVICKSLCDIFADIDLGIVVFCRI